MMTLEEKVRVPSSIYYVVEVRNLFKRFEDEIVLRDISFFVRDKEKVVLFGHNGSGKTTLIRCLLGFENFDGEINLFGQNINENTSFKHQIGYVPQVHPMMPYDVGDFVKFAVIAKRSNIKDFENICNSFNLKFASVAKKKINDLSGGMRQKIFLSLALLNNPKILFLDEPFSNLDIQSQLRLSDILKNLNCTQIISTHRIEDVYFADRVIYLQSGSIEADLPREEFIKSFSFVLKKKWDGSQR